MPSFVLLPQLGVSEESAVVSAFKVKLGTEVKVGSPLFDIETGKAVFEVASEHAGYIIALLCEEGDELPVKAPVVVIGAKGETYQTNTSNQTQHQSATQSTEQNIAANQPPAQTKAEGQTSGISTSQALASPRAKALAAKAGIDISQAAATGPEGLIIERDVAKALDDGAALKQPSNEAMESTQTQAAKPAATLSAASPATAQSDTEYVDKPLTTMRKIISETMMSSLSSMAQLTHSSSFDATEILQYRAKCKASDTLKDVTLGDMVLFAVSRALRDNTYMNTYFMGSSIRTFKSVHLAVAVDVPGGLLVPVIRNADRLSLLEISREIKRLAKACKDNTILPDELTGGTFTVSNLGNLGVEHFTPIINPPQVGILGVNTTTLRPRRNADGTIGYYDARGGHM